MARRIKRVSIRGTSLSVLSGKSLMRFCQGLRRASYHTLAVFFSVVLLSESVAATPGHREVKIAQQPETTSQDANRAAAQRAFAEGQQLFEQETVESRQQAIKKYVEALQLWRAVGDRSEEASTLDSIGLVYYSLGDYQNTLSYYNQALSLRRTLKQTDREAAMLWSIAGVYNNLGEKQKALDYYNQALSLFRAVDAPYFEALTLSSIGSLYSSLGEQQKALDALNQALTIQRATEDRSGEANTLQAIGIVYLSLGENQKALDALNQAVPLIPEEENRATKALILHNIGMTYWSIGENQKALDAINQALQLYKVLKNRYGEAATLQVLGGVYNSLGDKPKALDFLNQALVLLQAIGNRQSEAEILNSIGILYNELGENQLSLNSYNQALQIFRELNNPSSEAFSLRNIAEIYQQWGETQKALDSYNQALLLLQKVGDPAAEANTLTYIAHVYSSLGNYQLSLDAYNQALSLYRKAGNLSGEAQTLDSIAAAYRLLKEYQKALDFSNQALAMWRKQGNRSGQVMTLTTIVRIYESLGDYQQALNAATQILSLGRDLGDRFFEANGLVYMGRVYRELGDYQQALDSFNQGLSLMRAVGYRKAEPPVLDNLGKVYDLLDQPQKALESYNQALSLWQGLGERTGEAESLYSIAGVERKRGNLKEALTKIEAVINIVESLRTQVASQELRTSYFASVQKYYEFYIDLLMQLHKTNPSQGYDALALTVSERARARSLLELLSEANADIRQGVEPQLLNLERTIEQQLDAREKRRIELLSGNHTEEQAAALDKEIAQLLTQYQKVQAQIRQNSPRYAALTQPKPLTLKEIQQQVLDDDTMLLEYSLGEERSYLWAVTKTGITSYELPKRADIEVAAQRYRQALTAAIWRIRPKQAAEAAVAFSEMILKPVAQQLGNKRLLIVSDGVLQYVPFSALPIPGMSGEDVVPLLVNHEIVNSPSASTLAVLRREHNERKPAAKTLAVLADPVFTSNDERYKPAVRQPSTLPEGKGGQDVRATVGDSNLTEQTLERSARESSVLFNRLPFSRTEADRILSLVPASQRMQAIDFAANRATATNPELSQYQIVHFATHGILNSVNPELSGVVLSLVDEQGTPQNGFLRLHDVFNLNLPAELVVLSACQTGLGQDVKGEGLVGLTRGFMYAGAPRVLVSLWSVDDEGTSELMIRFYKKMLQEGLKPAAALRAAQLEMWKEQRWKAPYYWAAFTLQGEWQ